jgi:Bacterial PH domain
MSIDLRPTRLAGLSPLSGKSSPHRLGRAPIGQTISAISTAPGTGNCILSVNTPSRAGVTTTANPSPDSEPARAAPPRSDASGNYRQRGRLSYAVIGVYVFLVLVLVVIFPLRTTVLYSWAPWAVSALFVLFLARYVSTLYSLDDSYLKAGRILGGRRILLERVRRIEYANLRDLGSSGGIFGSWGWRGRMWSPQVGRFDAICTDAASGLLISADGVPLYISPVDVPGFARELSRRVRSYTGRLAVDVGDPRSETTES